ncbi:MAG TPA: hypothetical protein DEG69_01590 [Flavobacteriaceae bacterium]|nr:hypothetical protein [Flavobacteriaceae bacterium]
MRRHMAQRKQSKRMDSKKASLSKRSRVANNPKFIPCHVSLEKLVTLAELGLGVERPLNAEKRKWIAKLAKEGSDQPILVTPIKDSGYYVLADGWHRVQAAKKKKQKTIYALQVPVRVGLTMAKVNKVLRDIDKEFNYKLDTSGMVAHWAVMQTLIHE